MIREISFYKRHGPIAALAFAIIAFISVIHWYGASLGEVRSRLDLQDGWEVCLRDESSGLTSNCEDYRAKLPDNRQKVYKNRIGSSIEYRRTFRSPPQCIDPTSNGCVFYLGGVSQGAEISLNGHPLGFQFTRSDLYPVVFSLPKSELYADGRENQIRLTVFTRSKGLLPAVSQAPVAVVTIEESHIISQAIVGERVVLPLIGCAINLALALIALYWFLSKNSVDQILWYYIFYCLTAAVYMVNATRILREFLGYNAGTALNYGLHFVLNLSIFELVSLFFFSR